MPALTGLHHAALSVSDVDASAQWYRDVLGLDEMFRHESEVRRMVVMGFPGLEQTLGLVEHRGTSQGFSPHNLGLDQLAFSVASGEELHAWPSRLDAHGVTHSGAIETPFGGMVNLEDRDGIALALFWERS